MKKCAHFHIIFRKSIDSMARMAGQASRPVLEQRDLLKPNAVKEVNSFYLGFGTKFFLYLQGNLNELYLL
jgi:hypothetical protein